MMRPRKRRSDGKQLPGRRGNVDRAKAARAKAAIKAARTKSPQNKRFYRGEKWLKAVIDLESPKSPLVNVRLKSVINLDTFGHLSPGDKQLLIDLLPACDQLFNHRSPTLSAEALNNEFFAKACVEWCERLGEGEFLKDRQSGDANFKVRQCGTSNGPKSTLFSNFHTDSTVNAIPPHSRRRRGRPRVNRLSVDDGSEASSESSMPLQNGRTSRVPFPETDTAQACICQKMAPYLNDCPALRDHDYCGAPSLRGINCRCRFLRKSDGAESELKTETRWPRSAGRASSNGMFNAKPLTAKRRGRVSQLLRDYVVDNKNLLSKNRCDAVNPEDRDSGKSTLPIEIGNHDDVSKANGRCVSKPGRPRVRSNGLYDCKRSKNCTVDSVYHGINSSPSKVAASPTTFSSNDQFNCDPSFTRNGPLSVSSRTSSHSLVSDTPSSDNSSVRQRVACLTGLRDGQNKIDSTCSQTSVTSSQPEMPMTTDTNSVPCRRKKLIIKFIGLQKIALNESGASEECARKLCDSTRNGRGLHEFVVEEVKKYIRADLNTAYTGVYNSLASDRAEENGANSHTEENYCSNHRANSGTDLCNNFQIGGQSDLEKSISRTVMTDKMHLAPNVTDGASVDSVDCIWEAVKQRNNDSSCDSK